MRAIRDERKGESQRARAQRVERALLDGSAGECRARGDEGERMLSLGPGGARVRAQTREARRWARVCSTGPCSTARRTLVGESAHPTRRRAAHSPLRAPARVLIAYGADPNARNKHGVSSRSPAARARAQPL
jgi:hypothetical protein